MNNNEIFSLSVDIGKEIIRCGGEISRAKDTVKRINSSCGNECEIFALPSVIIAQCGKNTEIRQINSESTDLSELSRLNSLSRKICYTKNTEIHITKKSVYSKKQELAGAYFATGAFCLFFGGGISEALFSGLIGLIITKIDEFIQDFPVFTRNLICSICAAVLAIFPSIIFSSIRPDKIIIGTIMLMVPGLTVVNAIRDMMKGDLIAGLFELFGAIMSALAIALGVAGGIAVMNWI